MKNIKNFAQHVKEGYSSYPEQDYSALSENDYDPDSVSSRALEEEEEEDAEFDDYVDHEEIEGSGTVGNPANYLDYVDDYDNTYRDEEFAEHDADMVALRKRGEEAESEEGFYYGEGEEDDTYHIKPFSKFNRPEIEEFEEEFEDTDNIDDIEENDTDTFVGDVHPDANAGGFANLLDAHGAAIETGDKLNDLHHGGEYIVKELDPFKVIELSSGRVFGAEHEPDRFEVLDKGHSVDASHHKAHALHNLATQYCDDHELCQTDLGFKPSSYDHVFHSKALHDKLMGK